ncbi:MAG: DUF1972 domain-containing protein [Lachnospiraceae bacterium]|nr:DUF1972 domain-containing protein [Lachnospiraceae bacterium]
MQHVFIVGAKSLGAYGGYETFLNKLTEYHQDNADIKYHVACKADGEGSMDEATTEGAVKISENEFSYHNAHCFKVKSFPIGSAQAIVYDISSLRKCCKYIEKMHIEHPIVYILACRIGPVTGYFQRKIHALGGKLYLNPDGHEFLRAKWPFLVRKYWKLSERMMVKHSDLVICDSKNIEKYIHETYAKYQPKTTFIAYGAETRKSRLADDDKSLLNWYKEKGLTPKGYYLAVGRFVPENNYETMIREFMKSDTKRDFAIITTHNEALLEKIDREFHFRADKRIKFVGTVYDEELLMKIRENAYGYFHGHEVGGTNPSLLEALGSTELNLLFDIGFNKEVAEDGALYWNKEPGNMAQLIHKADGMSRNEVAELGAKAHRRIREWYSWDYIAAQYGRLWEKKENA